MTLFVVSMSRIALPASSLVNDGLAIGRRLSSFASQLNSRSPLGKRELKTRIKLINSLRFSSIGNIQEGSLRDIKANYPVKFVTIRTCGPLYQKWRETKKPYIGAPVDGLNFTVEYADTQDLVGGDDAPTILALHGAPGNHHDFAPLINHLTPLGARIIAPNFPDYSTLDTTKYFRHTFEEKREYLKDFVRAINVDNFDMMITHSSAVYPGMACWVDGFIDVRSFTLINPAGHRTIKGMKPEWFISNLCKFCLTPSGRAFFRKYGRYILAIKGVPVRTEFIDNALLSGTTMLLAQVERLTNYLTLLREKKSPLLYVFSENDKLIEKEIYFEMAEILGAKESNFSRFDELGNLTKKAEKDWMEILQFKKGGHYAFLKYTDTVNSRVEDLLKKVVRPELSFKSQDLTLLKSYSRI